MAKMTPAVVVRGELNGLGVIRSLARGGVPTILVDTTRLHAGAWSRFSKTPMTMASCAPAKWRMKFSLGSSTLSSGSFRASTRMSSAKKSGIRTKRQEHSMRSVTSPLSASDSTNASSAAG